MYFQKPIKIFILLMFWGTSFTAQAQYKYTAKATTYAGKILPHSKNLDSIAKGLVWGGELSFELATDGEQQWHHFWRFPNIGFSIGFINLGNNRLLGNALFAYPYLSVPLVKNEYINLNLKIGTGLSFITKNWHHADTLRDVDVRTANSAISFPINCYLTASSNIDFWLTKQLAIYTEIGFAHISNSSFRKPNFGINMLNAQIGAKYLFYSYNQNRRYNPTFSLPFDFEAKVSLSGFSREMHQDDNKSFFVGSLHAGVTYPVTNLYAIGGGIDIFYDGAFIKRPYDKNPEFKRYLIAENRFANKIRAGISFNQEIIAGRVSGIIDFGIYLYDPIKNAYADVPAKRGIFYRYNPKKEDGWNYIRLAVRYRFFDNLFLQAGVKLHLQTSEMFEFGVGYLLPFARRKHSSLGRGCKGYYLYRYDKKEEPAFSTPWVR